MLLPLLLSLAPSALAGERLFGFTYGYGTLPQSGAEVELYVTAKQMEGGGPNYEWQNKMELEYGITDRLEGAFYLVAGQENEGPLSYRGFKARLRYRFGSEGVASSIRRSTWNTSAPQPSRATGSKARSSSGRPSGASKPT